MNLYASFVAGRTQYLVPTESIERFLAAPHYARSQYASIVIEDGALTKNREGVLR